MLLLTALRWTVIERDAGRIAALRWQQTAVQSADAGSLSGVYASFVKE
jgi:hypothetical protein